MSWQVAHSNHNDSTFTRIGNILVSILYNVKLNSGSRIHVSNLHYELHSDKAQFPNKHVSASSKEERLTRFSY